MARQDFEFGDIIYINGLDGIKIFGVFHYIRKYKDEDGNDRKDVNAYMQEVAPNGVRREFNKFLTSVDIDSVQLALHPKKNEKET